MNKLQEIFDAGKPEILSEKKRPDGNTMTVLVPWVQADKKNQNKRSYPLALLQREVARIQSAVKKGAMIGAGDHPIGGLADIKTSSHILQKVWLDSKGKGYAEMKILPTQRGNTIQTLINNGAELGVSSRGFGNVSDTGVVQNDYKLMGIDIVTSPSYKEGTFNKNDIFESLEFEEENKEDLMFGLSEKYVEAMIESIYGMQIDEQTFEGGLEDFKKQKGNLVKAEILVAHEFFESTELALKHLGAEDEIKRIAVAPIQKRVTVADCYYEAQMAGVSPQEYCDRINAKIDQQEKLESESDFTTHEVSAILEEARQAGIDITDEKERKRILDIVREQEKQKALTENERAEIVAKRTGATVEFVKEIWAIERKKKAKEKKKFDKIQGRIREEDQAGFGSESRPDARKISKKILEGE